MLFHGASITSEATKVLCQYKVQQHQQVDDTKMYIFALEQPNVSNGWKLCKTGSEEQVGSTLAKTEQLWILSLLSSANLAHLIPLLVSSTSAKGTSPKLMNPVSCHLPLSHLTTLPLQSSCTLSQWLCTLPNLVATEHHNFSYQVS